MPVIAALNRLFYLVRSFTFAFQLRRRPLPVGVARAYGVVGRLVAVFAHQRADAARVAAVGARELSVVGNHQVVASVRCGRDKDNHLAFAEVVREHLNKSAPTHSRSVAFCVTFKLLDQRLAAVVNSIEPSLAFCSVFSCRLNVEFPINLS